MACIFIKKEGEIISVRKPDGSPSQLFQEALDYTGDRQKAIDLVAITQTEDFEEVVSYNTQEPSLQTVLDYVARENTNKKTLSAQQNQDLRNSLLSLNIGDTELFTEKLNKAYYKDYLFSPTQSSLTDSGIYTPYEVQNILSDISLQERIKSSLDALNNSEIEAYDIDVANTLEGTNEINSFGKITTLNPYVVQADIINTLAAPSTQQELNDKMAELPYPNFLENSNPEQIYRDMREYVKAESWQDNDGVIQSSVVDDTVSKINLGMKSETSARTLSDIETILNLPQFATEQNSENIETVLKDLEISLAEQGLDVIGISERIDDPSLKSFLGSLRNFLINFNLQNFISIYNDFFGKDISLKTIALKPKNGDRNYVILNTNKAEDTLLIENGLLKVDENTYIKIRRQPIEQLYNILYSYQTEYRTIEDYRAYIEQQTGLLDNVENPDNAEELFLMKSYFNLPLNITTEIDTLQEAINEDSFDGKMDYLTGDFIADFNIESLKQKQKNSLQWQSFYSNFEINNKGINLINNDPITINNLNQWIEEINPSMGKNLKQYSIISKQLPVLGGQDIEVLTSRDTERTIAINYPQTIDKITGDSYRIDDNTIISRNISDSFVRVGNDVYEGVEVRGNLTMYAKLPSNSSDYKTYKASQPKTKLELRDYSYLEVIPDKWMGSKKQNENIIKENFDCN